MAKMKKYNWLILLISTVIILFLHTPDVFINKMLFAEDGVIFFNQAQQYGVSSLLIPYAGYSHLILRLIALVASFFPVTIIPYIYLLFVTVLQFSTVFFTYKILKLQSYKYGLIIALFPLLVPAGCEVYCNLTNLQWPLAFLTALSVACNWKNINKYLLCTGLFLLALTGPFSVILIPVVILRMFVFKDIKINLFAYLSYFTGTFIQLFVLLFSHRVHTISNTLQLFEYIPILFYKLFCIQFLSVIIFTILVFALYKALRNYKEYFPVISVLYLGIMNIFSALFILNGASGDVIPGRYMYIYLTAVYLIPVIVFKNNKISALFIILLICCFPYCRYENIYWNEFIKFSKLQKDTFVPLPPDFNWYAKLTSKAAEDAQPDFVTEGLTFFNPSDFCAKYTGLIIETDNPKYTKEFMISDKSYDYIKYFRFYHVNGTHYKSNAIIPAVDKDIQVVLPPNLKINCYCID